MATIYRKYRAQNFQEIVGQDQVVQILRKAVAEDRFSHAYLFTGPRGTGKTSMARILSKAVNCLALNDGDPCNDCSNCLAINQGRFMDLIEIDAASNRGIDEIRGLKEGIGFLPAEGKRKVYIIDEVHMLTEPAFNALLKTLEEPPKQVMFILATTEPHKLPLTIISRTQRFDFRLADDLSLKIKLSRILEAEKVKLNDEGLSLIIKAGQGSFRDAETILEKVLGSVPRNTDSLKEVSKKEIENILGYVNSSLISNFIEQLINGEVSDCLNFLDTIYKNGANLPQFTKECLEEARKLMLQDITTHKGRLKKLLQIIKEFNQASQDIRSSMIAILPLELAVLNVCGSREQQDSKSTKIINEIPEKNVPVFVKQVITTSEAPFKDPIKVKTQEVVPVVVVESSSEPQAAILLIEQHWSQILDEAKKFNHFLTAILSGSKFKINQDKNLLLCVKSSFHKKQIENPETRRLLNKIISDICSISVDFVCIIDKELIAKPEVKNSNVDLVESILF